MTGVVRALRKETESWDQLVRSPGWRNLSTREALIIYSLVYRLNRGRVIAWRLNKEVRLLHTDKQGGRRQSLCSWIKGAGLVNLSRNNLCKEAVFRQHPGRGGGEAMVDLFCTTTVNCWGALGEGVSLYIQLWNSVLAEYGPSSGFLVCKHSPSLLADWL